jgi:mono/diheme cytochrome c family protein
MKTNSIVLVAALAALALAAACNKDQGSSGGGGGGSVEKTAAAAPAIDSTQAREIFTSRCAACHGAEGRGDGPGAAALNPKPRNYHDRDWQSKVTDDDIRKTITFGGAAVGKSPIMPASPDLEAKPAVVEGLVKIVRAFGKS